METEMKAARSMGSGRLSRIRDEGSRRIRKGGRSSTAVVSRGLRWAKPNTPKLVIAGSDGIGGAVENAVTNALGTIGDRWGFSDLVEFFAQFTEMKVEGFLFSVAPNAQLELVSRFLLPGPALWATRGIGIVPAEDFVADFEPAFFRSRARFDAGYGPGTTGLMLKCEAQGGPHAFGFAQFETSAGEEFVVRQWSGSADVLRKEVLEWAVYELFGSEADIEAVAIILAGSREILIHGAHEVVETALIVRAVAQKDIEEDAEDLALGVIRDAALGLVVEGIFLEPGIKARLFGTLPPLGGANLEFADLRTEVAVEVLLVPQTGANQGVGAVGACDAFGEPKRPRIHFTRIVERLKRRGTDPFDVPKVEKLVGRNV